jgi:hypothetical protein
MRESLMAILGQQLSALQRHIQNLLEAWLVAGQPRGSLAHSAGSRARAGAAGGLGWVGRAIEVSLGPDYGNPFGHVPRAQKS